MNNTVANITNKSGTIIGIAVLVLIVLAIIVVKILNIDILALLTTITKTLISKIGKLINKREKRYHRDTVIGKLTEKRMQVKIYRFLNDIIIDLGLKKKGATPYEFLFIVVVISIITSIIGCKLIFNNILMAIIITPIAFAGIMCGLYTKANITHDARIEAIIEAENIISNNIKDGVVVAVRNTIDMMPNLVRAEFEDFLDNVTIKNYHIRTALLELSNNLGSTADDFIKKCIVFELEEEHGLIGIFKDVVEVNNIKTEMRIDMKQKLEQETATIIVVAIMIFTFLGGIMAAFEVVRNFYLHNPIGQIIIAIDLLILVGIFVYLTYIRASEI